MRTNNGPLGYSLEPPISTFLGFSFNVAFYYTLCQCTGLSNCRNNRRYFQIINCLPPLNICLFWTLLMRLKVWCSCSLGSCSVFEDSKTKDTLNSRIGLITYIMHCFRCHIYFWRRRARFRLVWCQQYRWISLDEPIFVVVLPLFSSVSVDRNILFQGDAILLEVHSRH
jgi:hypothetical protein